MKKSGSGVLCAECDKEPPPPDSTPFNGSPASSALFPICIVPSIVFPLFPRLYFYSFLDCISTLSYWYCFPHEQRVLIAFCSTNRKVSLERLTGTMELHPHCLRHHRPHLHHQPDHHEDGKSKLGWIGRID